MPTYPDGVIKSVLPARIDSCVEVGSDHNARLMTDLDGCHIPYIHT